MAKDFKNAGSSRILKEVAKKNNVMGNVADVVVLSNDDLVDYPGNIQVGETADLEISIEEVGFIGQIDVTQFGQKPGKYVILSGHRRRKAGVLKGMQQFPCIVRTFTSKEQVDNFVLFANNQRDSSRDPFLFCALYKKHEDYLDSIGFTGNKRQEIAKRLDLSLAQADRYNTLHKVIEPVWLLIKDDIVGLSSVMPMASHDETQQYEILAILQQCLAAGGALTREIVKTIVDGYRDGKRSYAEITEHKFELKDSGLPLNNFINTEPDDSRDDEKRDRNSEIRREFDSIAAEADRSDKDREGWEQNRTAVDDSDDDNYVPEDENEAGNKKNKKPPQTEQDKESQNALAIIKYIEQLDTCFGRIYTFKNGEDADHALISMGSLAERLLDIMQEVSHEYGIETSYKEALQKISDRLDDIIIPEVK